MYYTVYKVTNKINGKFYIGTHKTKNLDDKYYGSGKYLRLAIEKYGLENFEKEILFIFDNPQDMYSKEGEIVNEDFLAEENTYNLKIGGFGGFDYCNQNYSYEDRKKLSKHGHSAIRKKLNTDPEFKEKYVKRCIQNFQTPEVRKKLKLLRKENPTFLGKKHSEKTKKQMSRIAKERLKDPTKNSQYGTRWIYSLEEKKSRKIKKEDKLPIGWFEGRKIKF